MFGLCHRQLLIERGQVISHAIGFLQQRGVVGAQKRLHGVVTFLQLRLQPQYLVGQPGNGGGRSPFHHFLFEVDIFIHAGLEERLGVRGIFTGGAQ